MPPGTRPIGGTYGLDALLAQAASRGVGSVGASLGQAAMGHGVGTTGMPAPQLSPPQPQGLPRRTPASFVRPIDQQALDRLREFAARGLPPEIVEAEFARITGAPQGRFDAYKGRRQDQRQQLQAQRGLDEMLSSLPPGVAQAAQLSQLGLPAGVVESVFAAQQGAGGATGLDPESATAVSEHVTDLIANNTPMRNARMIILGRMRAQGSTQEELDDAYDLIGQQYTADPNGAPLIQGRPLTSESRDVQETLGNLGQMGLGLLGLSGQRQPVSTPNRGGLPLPVGPSIHPWTN